MKNTILNSLIVLLDFGVVEITLIGCALHLSVLQQLVFELGELNAWQTGVQSLDTTVVFLLK